ncbi:hypothetical protein BDL97_13G008300 [Sphagnum fallax]|nr:hypothetical protein BDL97_13G008300 [Sphagnum fallax]
MQEQFFSSCIFIKAASFGGKDSEAGLQKVCKAMSDIHRRVVRRALLQANRRVVDPEKARRGLLSFRSRKLETKKKEAFVSRGGGLSVSIASKRKREWQGSGVVEEENNDDDTIKPSPLKRCTPPPPKQLPPKLVLLQAFYDGLEAAVSLLSLHRKRSTFESVCNTVEASTQRRFLHQHLAQIKHILPEAVKLEYVRCWDSDLQRNKWDLCISLLPMPAAGAAAVDGDDDESELLEGDLLESSKLIYPKQGNSHIETVGRRRAFHTRLLEFASTHLEEDDVPEGLLPERSFKAGSALNGRGNSKGLPISQSSGQLGSMKAVGSSESDDIEVELAPAMTCIPLEINTTPHRYSVPEPMVLTSTTHFTQLFQLQFSSKKPRDVVMVNSPGLQSSSSSESCELGFTTRLSHFSESFKPHFSTRFVIDRNMVHHSSMNNPMSIDSHSSPLLRTPVKVSAEESHHVRLCAQTSGAIDNSDSPCTPQFLPSTRFPTNSSNLSQILSSHSPSNSPYTTPLKKTATIRSLCFKTPTKTPLKMSSLSTQGTAAHCSRNIDYSQKPNSKVTLTSGTEAPVSSGDMNVIQCLPAELVQSIQ